MANVDEPRFIPPDEAKFASRFVFDVLRYTLKKCRHPIADKMVINLPKNVYVRNDFVKIAGICSLRMALIMRDSWRQMFISRHNSTGLVGLNVPHFISQIVKLCVFGRERGLQTEVQCMLALCNELTLFFYSKRLEYDANNVIGSIGGSIFFITRAYPDIRLALDGLFDKFENLKEYSKFLSDFVERTAIPYGFRTNVSDLFYQAVRARRIAYLAEVRCKKAPFKELVDHLGFLPMSLYSAILKEEAEKWPEHLPHETFTLESSRPPTLPTRSESTATGGGTSRRRHATESKKQCEEQGSIVIDEPPTLPTRSESTGTGGGTSRRRHATGSKKQCEEPRSVLVDEPPKSYASSESSDVGTKESGKGEATESRKDSEQTTQRDKDSSESGLEDELGRMSLGSERASEESRGAIPKRHQSSKDQGKSEEK